MARILDFFVRFGVEGQGQVKKLSEEIASATSATQGFNEAALNSAGLLYDLGVAGALAEGAFKIKDFVFPSVPVDDIIALSQQLGLSAEKGRELQEQLKLPSGDIVSAVEKIKQLNSLEFPVKDQFEMLSKEMGITIGQFEKLSQVAKNGKLDGAFNLDKTIKTVGALARTYNDVETAVTSMVAKVSPAYAAMIGANEKLNQQLLQSAATITATSSVSGTDGVQLKNIDSIRALQPKLKESIKEVEIATQSLVGITSSQTSEVFNVILSNTGKLNGQLKSAATGAEKFKDPLDAAAKLAPGMVATLGSLNLPMSQAADEIGNLLKGEIDNTAQVARSLGITREMVETWKSQGTLVDRLTEKFDPFIKANGEASKSVSGITSNIQDMFEILNREAGKPVTDLYVNALQSVYEVLQKVMPEVQKVFTSIVESQISTIMVIADTLKPVMAGVLSAFASIAPSIGPAIKLGLTLIENLFKSLAPFFEVVGGVIASIGDTVGALIPVFLRFNESFGFIAGLTLFINVASAVLIPVLKAVLGVFGVIASTIASIARDPFGAILLQAIAITIALAPMVLTLVKIQLLITSFGAIVATLGSIITFISGAVAGIQTLLIVAGGIFPVLGTILGTFTTFGAAVAGLFGTIGLAVSGAFGALVSGGIGAAVLSLQGSMLLLSASFASALAAAVPFLLAIAPLLAIGAAITLTLVVKKTKDLENTQTELDDLRATTNDISDNALKNAGKLKALADAAASGGLSAEQKQSQKDLIFGSKQQIKLIDDQIAAAKKLKKEKESEGASGEQLNQFDEQVRQLERAQKELSKYADAVTIASQPLADLGTASEQMARKVKAAQGIVEGGVGDPAKFKESAKLLSDLIQKQVELGLITADEGAKVLFKAQNNTKLDYEGQLAAKDAIVKLYQSRFAKIEELQSSGQLSNAQAERELESVRTNTELQLKVRVEAAKKLAAIRKETSDAELSELGAQTAEIAAKKATGSIGEAEAAKQTSETKLAESKIRIAQQQQEAANELNPEARRKLEGEVRKSQAEITKIEAEERDRRNAERLKDFDEKAKILQAGLDKGRVTEDQFNAQRKGIDNARSAEELKQLNEKFSKLSRGDKEGREALQAQIAEAESKQEANKKAANDRELATLQQSLDKTADLVRDNETNKKLEVEQAIADGVKTRADGEAEIAKVAIEGAEKTIEAEKSKLDKLKSFPPFLNPKENEALQNQIRDQENKTSELQLGLIQKRLAAERSALEERKKLIDEEYNRKNQASKNQDLDSQLELEKAVLGGSITRAEADNKLAQSSKNRIDSEFAAEKDKYDKLSNLKPLTNPEEERRRQDSLRQAEEKLKTAELAGVKKAQEVKRSNEEVEKNIAKDRKEEAEKDQKAAEETAKSVLDEIVAANKAADLEINRSKNTRLEASKTADFEALKKNGFDTEKIAREGAARELKIEQETLDAIYKMKVAQAADLAKSLEDNDISGPAAIEAVAQLQKEVSDLNLRRIDLEKKALEQLRAEKVRQIELELKVTTDPLQKKIDLLTQQKTLIEQQNSLIGAQDRLESASFNLAKQRSGFAIEDAKAAGGEAAAKGLEAQAAQDQLKFTQLQNASKIESIKLGLEQKAIDTDMARLQAQIALLQSQANLEKAIAEGKSKAQIDALNREVALRSQQVDLTAKAAENQKIIGGKELATAKIEGQIALERDQRAINKINGTMGATLNVGYNPGATAAPFEATRNTAVVTGSENLGKSLGNAVGAIDQFSTKLITGKTAPIPASSAAGPIASSSSTLNTGTLNTGFNPSAAAPSAAVPLQQKPSPDPKSGEASNSLKLFSQYVNDASAMVEMFARELYRGAMQEKAKNAGKTIAELEDDRARESKKTDPSTPSSLPKPFLAQKTQPKDETIGKSLDKPIDAVVTGSDSLGKSLSKAAGAIDKFSGKLPTGKATPKAEESVVSERLNNVLSDLAGSLNKESSSTGSTSKGLNKGILNTGILNAGFIPEVPAPFEPPKAVIPPPPPKPVEKPIEKPVDITASLGKPIADVAKGSESLGKSLATAVGAIDQFAAKLTTGKTNPIPTEAKVAIPARFSGGPIGAGEFFTGAELGPELAHHSDGSYQMLLMPGIYSLDRSAQIIPAQQTQQILRDSPMMTSVISTTIAKTDNTDLLHELRQLRSVVTQRRPQMTVPVSFAAPQSDGADRSMAALSRMLIRSGI